MKRQSVILLAVLILGMIIFLVIRGSSSGGSGSDGDAGAPGPAPAKLPRPALQARTPREAQSHLMEFLASEHPGNYRFQEIDSLMRKLDDAQLHELAAEIGFDQAEGALGWLRAALFEEWARRDLQGAMEFIARGGGHDSCYQQALYAVFRGSRPDDPRDAFRHLAAIYEDFGPSTGPFSTQWSKYALREIFGEMAQQDPDAAWALLGAGDLAPEDAGAFESLSKALRNPILRNSAKDTAMKGFFMGLPDEQTALRFAREFEQRWNSPAVEAGLKQFHDKVGRSSFSSPPQEEFIAAAVGLALAKFDLDAAEHWVATKGPNVAQSGQSRASGLWTNWSQQNPNDAIAVMRSGDHDDWHETIATGVMRGDARLAPEIIQQFHGEDWAARALEGAIPLNGTMSARDFFPASNRDAPVPDHHERYRILSDAITTGKFDPEVTQRLRDSLNRSFQSSVPAAQEAFGTP